MILPYEKLANIIDLEYTDKKLSYSDLDHPNSKYFLKIFNGVSHYTFIKLLNYSFFKI